MIVARWASAFLSVSRSWNAAGISVMIAVSIATWTKWGCRLGVTTPVAMAAAAMKTTRIRLGTGVLIPSNRIAPVAATAFASLNKLAPGRVVFGISTGFTGRRTMGLGAVKLADMEEYIRVVQALWRGETVEFAVEGK